MAKIPLVDFRRLHDPFRELLHETARRIIDQGRFIGGEPVKGFERALAAHQGTPGVVGTACGTSALHAALKAVGVGPGDEVIVPAHTAICTAEAATLCGARAVFGDIDDCFGLDPAGLPALLTPRTKAIVPVHLYGQPVDLAGILAFARAHGLKVVEDCAQAQGARYRGERVGNHGDAAIFSFFPSKNLGGFGDGGACTSADPATVRFLRMFCNHGREDKYLHEFEGINSRLDALNAQLLNVLLPHLDGWNAHRRAVAGWYREELAGLPQVELPRERPGTEPVYHLFVVLVPDREALAEHLKARGVETGVHYPMSLNLQPAYAAYGQGRGSFPRAERVCDHCLSLPCHPHLTRAEAAEVGAAIRAFYA